MSGKCTRGAGSASVVASHYAPGYNPVMVYPGRVKGGVIVPDPPANLPEGAQVNIELVTADAGHETSDSATKTARPFSGILSLAGQAQDLPADAARNYEHYLYGTDKEKLTDRT
jgi:hypothetical protein